MYIADNSNHRIRKVDIGTNVITTVAGNGGQGFGGDGGLATSASLQNPYDVTVDALGNMFIMDFANLVVRKVDVITGIITTIAGTAGSPGFSGDNGPAVSAQINYPTSISLDGLGNLYIADNGNNRIRKVETVPAVLPVVPGYTVTTFASGITKVRGVSTDNAGNVYTMGTDGPHVLKITPAGVVSIVATPGTQPGAFVGPRFDPVSGDLFYNHILGGTVYRIPSGGSSIQGLSGGHGPNMSDVTTDAAGNVYVARQNEIRKVFPINVGGIGGGGFTTPEGIAFGSGGDLFIGDSATNQIFRMPAAGGSINPFASGFNLPRGITADGSGNLYVSNFNDGTLSKVSPAGVVSALGSGFNTPSGLAFDPSGNLFVADHLLGIIFKLVPTIVTYDITASVGANGSISPPGVTSVNHGANQTYTITPDAGYHIVDVLVDGGSVGVVSSHPFTNVQATHTISATFAVGGVTVSLPSVISTYNQPLAIPVSLSEAGGIIAAEVTIEYDTNLLTLVGVSSTGTLSDPANGWSVQFNTEPGVAPLEKVKIALATGSNTISGPATFFNVDFTVNNVRSPASSALTLSDVLLNAGTPGNSTVNGLVTLVGTDGTIVFSSGGSPIPREPITVVVTDADADLTADRATTTSASPSSIWATAM